MIDPKTIDDLAKRLHEQLPEPLKQLGAGMEKQIKSVLQASLDRMDLVSREEFDIQQKVLQRTREKVMELEQVIAELEQKLNK